MCSCCKRLLACVRVSTARVLSRCCTAACASQHVLMRAATVGMCAPLRIHVGVFLVLDICIGCVEYVLCFVLVVFILGLLFQVCVVLQSARVLQCPKQPLCRAQCGANLLHCNLICCGCGFACHCCDHVACLC